MLVEPGEDTPGEVTGIGQVTGIGSQAAFSYARPCLRRHDRTNGRGS
jgi:hypothetical protein